MTVYTAAVVAGKQVTVPSRVATVDSSMSQATIQAALDAAANWSTVVFDEGTYPHAYTINKKLLVIAKEPGKTWITGARAGTETWTNESTTESTSDLWSCPMAYTPAQVLLALQDTGERYHLLMYATLAELKSRTMPAQSDYTGVGGVRTPGIGPLEGYTVAAGKLYVRFKAGYAPNNGTASVAIARSGVTIGLTINADDVTIAGMRLSLYSTSCIQVADDRQRTRVYHSYGEGGAHFFRALSGGTVPCNGLVVEHCEWNGGKVYTWRVESHAKEMWDALYSSNVSNRFVRANTRDITVRHNYGYEMFDGFEIKGFDTGIEPRTCLIEYNVLDGVVDNHTEFENFNQRNFVVIHHNFFKDGYTYLATAPNNGDRCEMRYNILWHSLHGITINDTDASKQKPTLMKTVTHGSIDATVLTQIGHRIVHTTWRIDGGAQARLYTGGDAGANQAAEQSSYNDCLFELNIIDGGAGYASDPWLLRADAARPGTGYAMRKNVIRGGSVTASHYQTDSTTYDSRPPVGDVIQTDPAFGTTPTTYFHPTNATIVARGDGAIVNGVWGFKGVPGPDWAAATGMPQRRAWHANVSKSYVNLA